MYFKMAKINALELVFYFGIWISANLYSLYKLFQVQSELLLSSHVSDHLNELTQGWEFLSRQQDVSDIEWSTWKYFFNFSWVHLLLQFIVSEILRHSNATTNILSHWYLASSVIFIIAEMGGKKFLLIFCVPLVYSVITFSGGKKKSLWFTSIILLTTYNSLKYKDFIWNFFDHDKIIDEEVYLVLFSIGWVQLRCMNYCLDYIEKKEKSLYANEKNTDTKGSLCESIIKMLTYVFYLPMLHSGPLIEYSEFEKSFSIKSDLLLRLKYFILNMTLYLIYIFLLDLSLHYIYFFAMQDKIELIRQFPTIALCGAGLWMGLQFHLKYVIFYGTAGAYAFLDNIETPPTPRCIARVHVYSQMWRYFDVGLYKFLIKYIYLPCFELMSKSNTNVPQTLNKLVASLITFLFIFFWHGTTWSIFIWMSLNFVGITLESFAKLISKTKSYKKFKNSILRTDGMEQRFIAMLCTPLLALSAISSFYLFVGYEIGNLYFECFTPPLSWNAVYVLVSLYSCCHVSMALQDVPSRTAVSYKKCALTYN